MLTKLKYWYTDLTKGEALNYSLSDTQFFWITTVWLMLFPFVAYAIFFLGVATWKEFLVFMGLEPVVLAFKYAKYIKVNHGISSIELRQETTEKVTLIKESETNGKTS